MTYALVGNIVLCAVVIVAVIAPLALAVVRSRTEAPRVTVEGNQHETRPARVVRPRSTHRPAGRFRPRTHAFES